MADLFGAAHRQPKRGHTRECAAHTTTSDARAVALLLLAPAIAYVLAIIIIHAATQLYTSQTIDAHAYARSKFAALALAIYAAAACMRSVNIAIDRACRCTRMAIHE